VGLRIILHAFHNDAIFWQRQSPTQSCQEQRILPAPTKYQVTILTKAKMNISLEETLTLIFSTCPQIRVFRTRRGFPKEDERNGQTKAYFVSKNGQETNQRRKRVPYMVGMF